MCFQTKALPRAKSADTLGYSVLSAMLAIYTLFVSSICHAEETEGEKLPSSVQIEVGGFAMTSFSAALCERNLDVIGCTEGVAAAGGTIGGQYRLGQRLALGAVSSFGFEYYHSDAQTFFWRIALDGRLYLYSGRITDFWCSLELGLTGAHAKIQQRSFSEGKTEVSDRQFGLNVGIGMGMDFSITESFAIGFSTRALGIFFGQSQKKSFDSRLDLGSSIWLVLGIHGRFQSAI